MAPPWWRAALACRCPACGEAPLFNGVLAVKPSCPACGLDLRAHDEERFVDAYRRLGAAPFKAAIYGEGVRDAA